MRSGEPGCAGAASGASGPRGTEAPIGPVGAVTTLRPVFPVVTAWAGRAVLAISSGRGRSILGVGIGYRGGYDRTPDTTTKAEDKSECENSGRGQRSSFRHQ